MAHQNEFANTIYDHSGLMATGNECFKFGITWGCTVNCPVLRRGECEHKDTENRELWEQVKSEYEIENL